MAFNKQPRVAIVSGFWAQNIGNAFFNIGGRWALEQVFGQNEVQFIQDNPAYRTFYDKSKGAPRNYAALLEHVDVDYVVLQGPVLTTTFPNIWREAFESYRRRGVKVILLGAAFFKYSAEEFDVVQKFFDEYPPAMVSTRDDVTYGIIKGWVRLAHSGIDSAFFVPCAFNPVKFDEPYLCLNFDRYPEPTISIDRSLPGETAHFSWEGRSWSLEAPGVQEFFSNRGKAQAYIGHLMDRRRLPAELAGLRVVRPEHRYAPHMTHKIYQHPGSFVSDEPFTYFSTYAGTELTLSDRVHACVMTLAYGKPAMLFTPSPRQALFSKLGLDSIRKEPVRLDMGLLEEERHEVLNFIRHSLELLE